LQAGCQEFESP